LGLLTVYNHHLHSTWSHQCYIVRYDRGRP